MLINMKIQQSDFLLSRNLNNHLRPHGIMVAVYWVNETVFSGNFCTADLQTGPVRLSYLRHLIENVNPEIAQLIADEFRYAAKTLLPR